MGPSTRALWFSSCVGIAVAACSSESRPHASTSDTDDGGVPDDERDAADAVDSEDGSSMGSEDGGLGDDRCAGDVLSFSSAASPGRTFFASLDGAAVQLASLAVTCGVEGSNGPRAIVHSRFGSTGQPDEARVVVNADPNCASTRDPLILTHGEEDALLVYGSNELGSFQLLHRSLLTDDDGPPVVLADTMMLAVHSAGAFLSEARIPTMLFSSQNGEPVPPVASDILSVQVGAEVREVAASSDGFHARDIVVFGADGERGGLAAWVSDASARVGVYARLLGPDGRGEGDFITLSASGGAYADVALTAREQGGAIVYATASQGSAHLLSFRAIDADLALGAEVALTRSNEDVGGVAITAYAGGYAVLYRRLPAALSGNPALLRLLFVDAVGNVAGSRVVAEDVGVAPGLQLLAASDGTLFAFWSDEARTADAAAMGVPSGSLAVHAARLRCF